jgi:hypothetical protein
MFYYIYKDDTKQLISESSTLIPEKSGYTVISFEERQLGKRWNTETLTFDDAPASRVLDAETFINKFTATEQEDIIEAAKTSKKAARFIEILKLVKAANLDSEFIQTSVNAIESAGIIDTGRAAEVLS